MREVSCRVLDVWRSAAVEHGLRFEQLVQGLPNESALSRESAGWMDWDTYVEIIERFERATSADAVVVAGRAAVRRHVARPTQRFVSAALSLQALYQVVVQLQLPLIQRNVRTEFAALGPQSLRVVLALSAGERGSSAWLRSFQGALEGLSTLRGLPLAQVAAEIEPHRAVFHVTLPEPRPQPLRKWFQRWLIDSALVDLERQMEDLRTIDRERSALETALRERERMMGNLLANLSGMVYRCRREDWTFEYVSDRSDEVLGYTPEELLDRGFVSTMMVHPDDLERLREERGASIKGGEPSQLEYRIRTRSGETRWVFDVARGVRGSDGRVTGIEGFVTDVTARKRLEEELGQSRRVEGIGRLAGGIAHDFNNLLTVILGSADLTQALLPPDSKARVYADQTRAAAERAAALTHQLLAFARKQVIEPRFVDLNALVHGMRSLLSRTLMEAIELECWLAGDLWSVAVDPGQFEQVLLNLAINARDAMPEGGMLRIETANIVLEHASEAMPGMPAGLYVMLAVNDTGTGMSEEVQRRAFEPFFTTKEVGKGTGLGLASSHGIVRQARGHIFLSSEPNQGTSVRIYLPRSEGVPVSSAEHRVSEIPAGEQRETVLVVEDHELVRGILVNTLEAHGYSVLAASSGQEALSLVAEVELDLVISDIVMPRMSGLDLARKLAQLKPGLPVLYLSGYSEQYALREVRPMSQQGFLRKPFTPSLLLGKVREMLEKSEHHGARRRRAR